MLLAMPKAALADDFIKGVYLQSEELCEQARKDSLQTVIEAGNTMLSARGIESIEYNCEFVQMTRATRSPTWLVQAVCQEPGYLSPDVLTILEMNATQLDLVSVKPADPDSGGGNGGSYFLCEGVPLP
ncbi:hypothetical protein RB623_27650 [Mesorhizobium sp. LHD-90]|uniref:hypothetical protein n=1 Tax=Mesorhizobium sp. LHD-90 TaxID=3071414 RepID=UPI0027E1861E|nr:hypothetical protein [Mesorhizobium sp. LHD-90]MDQ6437846.1 hypothetical protein [Mesorhizobium sp. LHD-90]